MDMRRARQRNDAMGIQQQQIHTEGKMGDPFGTAPQPIGMQAP
jgi:hypothetical protein